MISSRKTRALVAYLALTNQTHSREHLCELFFERTSDPRGALRWSLSRIRGLLRDEGQTVLVTTKDAVHLNMDHVRA